MAAGTERLAEFLRRGWEVRLDFTEYDGFRAWVYPPRGSWSDGFYSSEEGPAEAALDAIEEKSRDLDLGALAPGRVFLVKDMDDDEQG